MYYNEILTGDRIRELRKQKGMTIPELAEAAGCSEGHLNQIELGIRKFSFELFFTLMTVLDTDANTLLGVSGKKDTGRNVLQERMDVLESVRRDCFISVLLQVLDGLEEASRRT